MAANNGYNFGGMGAGYGMNGFNGMSAGLNPFGISGMQFGTSGLQSVLGNQLASNPGFMGQMMGQNMGQFGMNSALLSGMNPGQYGLGQYGQFGGMGGGAV